MSQAVLNSLPVGPAGMISRDKASATVDSALLLSGSAPTAYGTPLVRDSSTGKFRAATSGDTDISGFLALVYPSVAALSDTVDTQSAPTAGFVPNMRRGWMVVTCNNFAVNAPAPGGQVYVRIASASSGKPLNGIEAAADGSNTLAIPGCYFEGAYDPATGNVEISFHVGH